MRKRRFAALAVALIVCGAAQSGVAQNVRDYEQRVDAFKTWSQAATAKRVSFDEMIARRRMMLDTVRVDYLNLLASHSIVDLARASARQVVAQLSVFGTHAPRLLADKWFVVRTDTDLDASPLVVVAMLSPVGHETYSLWGSRKQTDVVDALEDDARRLLAEGLGNDFRYHWAATSLRRSDSVTATGWANVRVQLVSSPTSVARKCYAGDLTACRLTLGLQHAERPARDFYDHEGRRRVIARDASNARRINGRLTQQCLRGSDNSCIELLEQYPPNALPVPLNNGYRETLLQLALSTGGDGAMRRLFDAPGGAPEKLAAAANMPLDSLLSHWQQRVRNTATGSDNMSFGIAAASFGWIMLFGAMSLRSSRWR